MCVQTESQDHTYIHTQMAANIDAFVYLFTNINVII